MDIEQIKTTLSVAGLICCLFPFVMLQLKKWTVDTFWYRWLNILGSLVLLALSIVRIDWVFIILESVWFIFSVKDVVWNKTRSN